ncbi:glycosyltransferase family 1 protein [Bradyrhizobium sp. Arg816]|uniref:glycosyltransferase family 4 protein n=1 Tax=Bradyrhizobium sp. Arg816 TaxID=2998491 RepID=UPI00249E8FE4|nr:glycosyltransferase family 1 protein [Bradyrhizobium sp. Arg816]MDI3566420.1 glycosyltransferase family 1 protein [Bradyrhizobium sp. Arg816]
MGYRVNSHRCKSDLLIERLNMDARSIELVVNGRFLTQEVTGVQRYGHELLHAIDRILPSRPGLSVSVVCPVLNGEAPVLKNIPIQQRGRLQGHAWEQFELPRFAWGKVLFCPGNTAPAVSLIGGQRVLVTVHDLSYLYFPEAYSRAFRATYGFLVPLAFRCADRVVTVSESERISILKHYPGVGPKIVAIPNGGLANDVLPKLEGSKRDEGHVLYVGSLSKRKNFPRMLEIACALAKKKGYRFTFVGGTAGGLVESASHVPEESRELVKFVGQVNDGGQLIELYKKASLFMFPSNYESSGLPPIEAMACGCPVLTSDIPALRERCGDAAIYCDPYDTANITSQIEQLLEDKALLATLSAKGRERAQLFTWNRCAQSTLDLVAPQ